MPLPSTASRRKTRAGRCAALPGGIARPRHRPGPQRAGDQALVLDDGKDVLLADDEVLLVVQLELRARVLREEDLLALLHVHRVALALVVARARPEGDNHPLLGLLLGRVRKDDAALGHLLALEGLDHDTVAERLKLRLRASGSGSRHGCSSFVSSPFSTLGS